MGAVACLFENLPFVAFFIFFISALAEGTALRSTSRSRVGLVAGAFTEYSPRSLLFFLVEWQPL
jgi:NADH:ubiquinone oxidoreductase subunit H